MITKVFLDTNVLLDVLTPGRRYEEDSRIIFDQIRLHHLEAVLTTQSITDASYVIQHTPGCSPRLFRESIRTLLRIVNLEPVGAFQIQDALNDEAPDFEDLALGSCAYASACEYIITGDEHFLCPKGMQVSVMTPSAFVEKMRGKIDL